MQKAKNWLDLARELIGLPHVRIDLRLRDTVGNDPFFHAITKEFYRTASARHPKFPLARRMEYGVALCDLRPPSGQTYTDRLESAARRNLKKAIRLGYSFEVLDYNTELEAITSIHRSQPVRQGRPMPQFLLAHANPHHDPPSRHAAHAYPYYGIFKDEELVAYASCLVAGELCAVERLYGHADHLANGVVPLLLASIAEQMHRDHPQVRYHIYDTYYGASETLQRFKRKFLFLPHRVEWLLGDAPQTPKSQRRAALLTKPKALILGLPTLLARSRSKLVLLGVIIPTTAALSGC